MAGLAERCWWTEMVRGHPGLLYDREDDALCTLAGELALSRTYVHPRAPGALDGRWADAGLCGRRRLAAAPICWAESKLRGWPRRPPGAATPSRGKMPRRQRASREGDDGETR